MKFKIFRISGDEPPHPDAVQEDFIFEQREPYREFALARTKEADWEYFKREGFDHHIADNGDFVRSKKEKRWFIEVNSLDELITIAQIEGRGIIFNGEEIHIYDDYAD